MRRIVGVALMCVLLGLALAGCGSSGGDMTLTDADNGKNVDLKAGQTLRIVLTGNPTTGFTWKQTEGDDKVVKQVGDFEFKLESDLTGAAGEFTFTYKAVAVGTARVKLEYARPWETVPPEQTFQITVSVE